MTSARPLTRDANDTDIPGRPWAKLSELKVGDVLIADGGFTCLKDGARRTVKRNVITRELYIDCANHGHTLVGQVDDGEHLIGLYSAPEPTPDKLAGVGGGVDMSAPDLIAEFRRCLGTMTHSRAGWDYDLPREQRDKENREERDALARARAIWSENPDRQEELRAAFTAENPLARMAEIEQASI